MDAALKILRIFIATPNDLNEERQALREIVDRLHGSFSKEAGWGLELLGWETTLPGAGRPQHLINADVDSADLFIGCLWQRWGSPSGLGDKTGFEEEFDRAFARNGATGSPEIYLFFKKVGAISGRDAEGHVERIRAFRSRLISEKRLLFREFETLNEWRESVFECIHRKLLQLVRDSLGPGLGSSAKIEYGTMRYLQVPVDFHAAKDLTIHFDSGFLLRRPEGGMVLQMRPSHAYPTLTAFQNALAPVVELTSTANVVSTDPSRPTTFVGSISATIPKGTMVPDQVQLNRANPSVATVDVRATATLRAALDGTTLRGTLEAGAEGAAPTVRTSIELRLR